VKIAAVSDDGRTISQHFGRARYYVVVTVEDGQVVGREMRERSGLRHTAGHHEAHHEHDHGSGHGFDPAAQERHARMAAAIADCQVLLARGMGAGAYEGLRQAGIRPILTDIADIDQAVQAVISGQITDHPERLY